MPGRGLRTPGRRTSLVVIGVLGALGMLVITAGSASPTPAVVAQASPTTPPPTPSTVFKSTAADTTILPWRRQYITNAALPPAQLRTTAQTSCNYDIERGVQESKSPGPRLAVLGDNAMALVRPVALKDPLYHWGFATHCGEKFDTAVTSGRLDDVLAFRPDVLVLGLGLNDMSERSAPRPAIVDEGLKDLQVLLDKTDALKCRVVVDLPNVTLPNEDPNTTKLRAELTSRINDGLRVASSRPGVRLARWDEAVQAHPEYLVDPAQPNNAGINGLMNTIVDAAQGCLAKPPATVPQAINDPDGDFVEWNPVGSGTTYYVEASDGRLATTADTAIIFPHRSAKDVRYRLTTRVGNVLSAPSAWSAAAIAPPESAATRPTWLGVSLIIGGYVIAIVAMLFVFLTSPRRRPLLVLVHGLGIVLALIGWVVLGQVALIIVNGVWLVVVALGYLDSRRRARGDRQRQEPPSDPGAEDDSMHLFARHG